MITGLIEPGLVPQPWVRVAIQIADLRPRWVPLLFVVDTGASLSCIHAIDAQLEFGMTDADLDPSAWPSSFTIGGVGGSVRYRVHDARFAFQHDDGHLDIIGAPIRIGGLESGNLPPLLGCDILRHFEVTFRYGGSITLNR